MAGEGRRRHRRRQSKIPLPVDISISADDDLLWVDTWNDGKVHLYDIRDPHAPKQIFEQQIGEQLNMVSESWDGKRVYFTSSLLANWDKTASTGGDLQFFKLYSWDGKALTPAVQHRLRERKTRLAAPDALRRVFAVRAEAADGSGEPQQ